MIKYHETIEPLIPKSFFDDTVNLWRGTNSGHMGHHLYKHHTAKKDQMPMSGLETWAKHAATGTLPKLTRKSLTNTLPQLQKHIIHNETIIEFGPGAMNDALPLIKATGSKHYIPVDCSLEILKQAQKFSEENKSYSIEPAVTDFFSQKAPPLTQNQAFGALLGLTISNLPGPIAKHPPKPKLIELISNLSKTMPAGGALLIQIDTCQNAAQNIHLYSEHAHSIFGVNHIHRMREDLTISEFDPNGFTYLPTWHEESKLLAHNVIATKDQSFYLGEERKTHISINEGDIFHYNNSFKYSHDFFEECAAEAGLSVIERWQEEDSTICMYLFDVPAKIEEATAPQITQERYGTNHNYYETDNAQIAI